MSTVEASYNAEERRFHLYRQSVIYIGEIGTRGFGVSLGKDTMGTMQGAFELMARVDEVLDHGKPDTQAAVMDYLEVFADDDPTAALEYPLPGVDPVIGALAISGRAKITAEQAAEYGKKGKQIIQLGNTAKQTTNVTEYAGLAMLTGELSAGMLFSMVPEEERTQTGYERFVSCIIKLSRAGTVADWAADLEQDNRDGLTIIRPTLANKLRIAKEGAPDLFAAVKQIGPKWAKLSGLGYQITKKGLKSALLPAKY